ncbi:hypothetical protein TrVE_jg1848 [Triparma verrucosa]|uniref:Uncharacterized protein n=1 Tax=Triparma verrucosa TaxID=1606542 RepID=A0A9W7CBY2_9STRA|nr:hypothetical protein TrVE_jg1848 [Triparma verrucosa]
MTSQSTSIFSTAFSDIPPESPYKSPSSLARQGKNYSMMSSPSPPATPETLSLLNHSTTTSTSTLIRSPTTHTYTTSSRGVARLVQRRASPPKNYTSSGGRLVDVKFLAAAKLIDEAQSNVESARQTNLQKSQTISELTDLLNKSLSRQTLLESRLHKMNATLLQSYDSKNLAVQEKSIAQHQCTIAKSHAIEHMKKKEEAEKFISKTLAEKNLLTAQLGKSSRDLSISISKNSKMASDLVSLEVKIRALQKWGDMLEGAKNISEKESIETVKVCEKLRKYLEKVRIEKEEIRTKYAVKFQEITERCIGLEKENESLRRKLMDVSD